MQASALPAEQPPFIVGSIDVGMTIPPGDYVVIHSPGGRIDVAWQLGPQLKGKTCIIKGAASAALQILLPFCKERYYLPSGFVMFHSTHVMFPPDAMFSQADLEMIAKDMALDTDRMIVHLMANGFPLSEAWLKKVVKEASLIKGKGLLHLHPWLLPVEQCFHCPEWIKMLP